MVEITRKGMLAVPRSAVSLTRDYTYSVVGFKNKIVTTASWTVDKDYIYYPRAMSKFTSLFSEPFKVVDKTSNVPLNIKRTTINNFELRDYQEEPVSEILDNFNNDLCDILLQAGTAFGKTTVLSYIITKISQKTLIVTDRTILNEQMFESISKFSNLKVGMFKKGINVDDYDVLITTFQFFTGNIKLFVKNKRAFGFIVIDEVHIIGATKYLQFINTMDAKYRLGLSATPTRSDGLTQILYDSLDVIVHGNNPDMLVPDVYIHNSPFVCTMGDETVFRTAMDNFLVTDEVMQEVCEVVETAYNKGRKIFLVLSGNKAQKEYNEYLNNKGITSAVVNAHTKNRKELFAGVTKGETGVLIGASVLEKGVDIPALDTMILADGFTTIEKLKQGVGRISRVLKDKKQTVVVDFTFQGIMNKGCMKRREFYKQMFTDGIVDLKSNI